MYLQVFSNQKLYTQFKLANGSTEVIEANKVFLLKNLAMREINLLSPEFRVTSESEYVGDWHFSYALFAPILGNEEILVTDLEDNGVIYWQGTAKEWQQEFDSFCQSNHGYSIYKKCSDASLVLIGSSEI